MKKLVLILTAIASLTIATTTQALTCRATGEWYGFGFDSDYWRFCYAWGGFFDEHIWYRGVYCAKGFTLIKNFTSKFAKFPSTYLSTEAYYHYPNANIWWEKDGLINDDSIWDPTSQHWKGPLGMAWVDWGKDPEKQAEWVRNHKAAPDVQATENADPIIAEGPGEIRRTPPAGYEGAIPAQPTPTPALFAGDKRYSTIISLSKMTDGWLYDYANYEPYFPGSTLEGFPIWP